MNYDPASNLLDVITKMRPISKRKANGVFYTPPEIARYIVERTLELLPHERLPRVLDPACGDGVLLQAVAEQLVAERWSKARQFAAGKLLRRSIFGIDQDATAIEASQARLRRVDTSDTDEPNLRVANTLFDEPFAAGSFDAVVGNPPYVNVRVLSRTCSEAERRRLRERYRCARGAFDLYVLFIERAFEMLRPGGVCGMIVPNKVATLEYARPCRELLLERTTIHHVADVTELGAFRDASVYPYILVWQKQPPPPLHHVSVLTAQSAHDLSVNKITRHEPQASLSPEGFALHGSLHVEERVPTLPFGKLAKLHSGTTGFSAQRVASDLQEANDDCSTECFQFVVSGNIDPYMIRTGKVRYMKRSYDRPLLPVTASCLTVAKRDLFARAKIVIAGMTRRLEAAYDPGGLALGVQVYAASDLREDACYLLGLLNSKLMSHLFRLRFRAKRLANGYFAMNKRQLAQLPIRVVDADDTPAVELRLRIIGEVKNLLYARGDLTRSMQAIDRFVYRLYRCAENEIDDVESSVPDLSTRANAA